MAGIEMELHRIGELLQLIAALITAIGGGLLMLFTYRAWILTKLE